MRWLCSLLSIVLCSVAATAQEPKLVAETEPLSPQEQLRKFHLPPGFEIQLVAAEPDVRKPMNLKFDTAGRLYFTQSVEYPWPAPRNRWGQDTIRVMTDTNGDGVPDHTQVFADGLNIPIGIVPVRDGLLSYSIPELNFFQKSADGLWSPGRREFFGDWGFRDTHGMCSSLNWWIDGWVYGCHGFANDSKVKGQDGKFIVMQSGNTYRLRPDGTRIEYYTHGQVNPFGMCLDPWGFVYTSDCHTRPAYQLVRGAYYPSFGKPHEGLGYGPEIMQHAHGSTGLAGVIYYAADHFPAEYQDNLFIGNPVTGRINRDTLAWTGATPKAIEQPDFVTCDDPWFRPVDIQLAPDGSIYVADFYNRIIGHYEVPLTHPGRDRERGRIWRIRYVGTSNAAAGTPTPANFETLSVADLIQALDHPNLTARVPATHLLVEKTDTADVAAIAGVLQTGSPRQQAHALWVLHRQQQLTHPQLVAAAQHVDALVRVHAMRVLGELSSFRLESRLLLEEHLLNDPDARVQRAAAEALGKQRPLESVSALITARKQAPPADAMLIHTIKVALRDLLQQHQPQLLAWSAGGLTDEQIPVIAEISLAVPGPEAAIFLAAEMQRRGWALDRMEEYVQLTVRYLPPERLARLDDAILARYTPESSDLQLRVLRALQRGLQERGASRSEKITAWAEGLAARLIVSADPNVQRAGIDAVRDLRLPQAATALPALLAPAADRPTLRTAVLDALAAVSHPELVPLSVSLFSLPEADQPLLQHAAQVLGSVNREDSRTALVNLFATAPQAAALAIARGLSVTQAGGEALFAAIEQGRANPRLLQDRTVEERLRSARVPDLDARRNRLLEGLPAQDEQIGMLLQQRRTGFLAAQPNLAAGQVVFKQQCAGCHRLRNDGGKVGPELDGVGLRGLDRLLEDTLDPSRNVDQAFRTTVVAMEDGRVLTGLALREEGQTLIMADDQGREVRLPIAEIDERKIVKLSPMPANVTEKLTEQQYFDLLGYLLEQRAKSAAKE